MRDRITLVPQLYTQRVAGSQALELTRFEYYQDDNKNRSASATGVRRALGGETRLLTDLTAPST